MIDKASDTVLECVGLHKAFGRLVAVRDADLALRPGQIVGLVGPNGAGKTTLLRMLATLLRPTRGSLRILGRDARTDARAVRRAVGFLPDFFNLHRDLTLDECLRFYACAYGTPVGDVPARVTAALAATALLDKRNDFVRHLSRGMVQRLGMAMLMVRDAGILLLDEPASGLDPTARLQLRRLLKDLAGQGKAILISSHILSDLEDVCSHVAVMDRSRLVLTGTFADIRRRASARQRHRIRVLGDPAAALAVAARAGAVAPQAEPDGLSFDTAGDEDVARVNAALVAAGVLVVEIERLSDLEDAFVRITSGKEAGHEDC